MTSPFEAPAAAIVMAKGPCAVCPAESVNTTLKVDEPASVGTPEMTPDAAFRVRPEGNEPENVH